MHQTPTPRVLVVVPALNEASTITTVVRAARDALGADVLVVDDGSQDDTARLALAAGAHVVQHPFNLGVGAAIRTGLRVAAAGEYDAVVQIDGDGQHDTGSAASLLAPVLDGHADLVVGSRFRATAPTPYRVGTVRRLAMRVLSGVVSRRVGVRLTDTTSGFRAFGRPAIARFARSYPTTYLSDTVEALLLAADAGLRIEEQPAAMGARLGGRPSVRAALSLVHLLRVSLVISLHRVRRPLRHRAAVA